MTPLEIEDDPERDDEDIDEADETEDGEVVAFEEDEDERKR
jgi:hypothetical protein